MPANNAVPRISIYLVKTKITGRIQVAFRLADEYGVDCVFEPVRVATARWVVCDDSRKLSDFRKKANENLALDHSGQLVYIAPSQVNLSLTTERWPDIQFRATREHALD